MSKRIEKTAITSIIIPTYKEVKNMEPLITRLFKAIETDAALPKNSVEVVIVDDNSRDGTQEIVENLAKQGYNVRIIVRTKERGLSSAVIRGFEEAKGSQLICMDADLQVGFYT
jgi:dolichol-phosphate mannosyltransferase